MKVCNNIYIQFFNPSKAGKLVKPGLNISPSACVSAEGAFLDKPHVAETE